MTRREEIVKAAHEFYKGDEVSTFVVAAQWADKTMIEKACKWLINIDFDGQEFRDCDETFNNDLFVDAFRKVMQNE